MADATQLEMIQKVGERWGKLLHQCAPVPTPEGAADLPVHVTHWGQTGPEVLLVHGGVQGGIGGGPVNFGGQRPLAERGWRLNLVDRPGFGASPSRGPDNMEADGELIAALLGNRSHLIGHSFGGAVSLLAAARRPAAVASLILIEPALQAMVGTDAESMADPDVQAGTRIVVDALLVAETPADFALAFAQRLGNGATGGPNPPAAGLAADPDRAHNLGCSLLQARMATPEVLIGAARAVVAAQLPVLVISGGYTPNQDSIGRALARMLAGRHVIVPAPNHFVQEANPDEFNDVVDAFMREGAR
jgi:pimeloyl-ACP methyl ester carboxylesterase